MLPPPILGHLVAGNNPKQVPKQELKNSQALLATTRRRVPWRFAVLF